MELHNLVRAIHANPYWEIWIELPSLNSCATNQWTAKWPVPTYRKIDMDMTLDGAFGMTYYNFARAIAIFLIMVIDLRFESSEVLVILGGINSTSNIMFLLLALHYILTSSWLFPFLELTIPISDDQITWGDSRDRIVMMRPCSH